MHIALVSLFVIISDQLLKITVTRSLSPGETVPLIKNFFHITLVLNKGAAFGILKNQTLLFITLSIIAILFIIYYLSRSEKITTLSRLALGLILGGAISNLMDRIRLGCVIDFLDFRVWPVFNMADSAITIGAILFAAGLLRKNASGTV